MAVFLAALASALAPIPEANATSVFLRPNVDINNNRWTVVGSAYGWSALDDPVDETEEPNGADYITVSGGSSRRAAVGLTSTPIRGAKILEPRVWWYSATSAPFRVDVGGGGLSVSAASSSVGWHSVPIPLTGSQTQLDELFLEFNATWQPGTKIVSAAFVHLSLAPRVYWGAWMDSGVYGYGEPENAPLNTNTWSKFEENAGKSLSLVHFGQNPPWINGFNPAPFEATVNKGAIPFVDMANDLAHFPTHVTLKEIDEGKVDAVWKEWAKAVAAYGKPFLFRWDWEMNGDWFPYSKEIRSIGHANLRYELFRSSWRRLHGLADQMGASNITWVWCPNVDHPGGLSLSLLYPGHQYVDWTCMDGYNWGGSGWQTFYSVFKQTYDQLLAIAPSKPILIGETAATELGGSKAGWITDALLTQLPNQFPAIRGIAWFNWNHPDGVKVWDWAIESSEPATKAFAGGVASPYYAPGVFSGLKPLTRVVPLP